MQLLVHGGKYAILPRPQFSFEHLFLSDSDRGKIFPAGIRFRLKKKFRNDEKRRRKEILFPSYLQFRSPRGFFFFPFITIIIILVSFFDPNFPKLPTSGIFSRRNLHHSSPRVTSIVQSRILQKKKRELPEVEDTPWHFPIYVKIFSQASLRQVKNDGSLARFSAAACRRVFPPRGRAKHATKCRGSKREIRCNIYYCKLQ